MRIAAQKLTVYVKQWWKLRQELKEADGDGAREVRERTSALVAAEITNVEGPFRWLSSIPGWGGNRVWSIWRIQDSE